MRYTSDAVLVVLILVKVWTWRRLARYVLNCTPPRSDGGVANVYEKELRATGSSFEQH